MVRAAAAAELIQRKAIYHSHPVPVLPIQLDQVVPLRPQVEIPGLTGRTLPLLRVGLKVVRRVTTIPVEVAVRVLREWAT